MINIIESPGMTWSYSGMVILNVTMTWSRAGIVMLSITMSLRYTDDRSDTYTELSESEGTSDPLRDEMWLNISLVWNGDIEPHIFLQEDVR